MAEQRIAVVTGASAGIGKAAARQLLAQGWRVIGVGRNPARCAEAEAELGSADFTMLRADMALMADVRRIADTIAAQVPRVDALLNNAGGVSAERVITAEGLETTFAGNHLAPFLLTARLMPLLRDGRVVAVSSSGHEVCPAIRWDDLTFAEGFVGGAAYCHAKLANLLFARELARRGGVISQAMHPGVVASNFASHCDGPMRAYMDSIQDRALSPDAAADTLVWLAQADLPGNGLYWHAREQVEPSAAARDDTAAARLWQVSEDLVRPWLN
jgi:NAD(P)-dependent dehydrogenase (short-subunit alcohol dehydrogenase family)